MNLLQLAKRIGLARGRMSLNNAVSLMMIVLAAAVIALVAAIFIDNVITGHINATITVSIIVAVLTLAYVILTYLLLRQQQRDRHRAAIPFVWCNVDNENAAISLAFENRSQNAGDSIEGSASNHRAQAYAATEVLLSYRWCVDTGARGVLSLRVLYTVRPRHHPAV